MRGGTNLRFHSPPQGSARLPHNAALPCHTMRSLHCTIRGYSMPPHFRTVHFGAVQCLHTARHCPALPPHNMARLNSAFAKPIGTTRSCRQTGRRSSRLFSCVANQCFSLRSARNSDHDHALPRPRHALHPTTRLSLHMTTPCPSVHCRSRSPLCYAVQSNSES